MASAPPTPIMAYIQVGVIISAGGIWITGAGCAGGMVTSTGGVGGTGSSIVVNRHVDQSE